MTTSSTSRLAKNLASLVEIAEELFGTSMERVRWRRDFVDIPKQQIAQLRPVANLLAELGSSGTAPHNHEIPQVPTVLASAAQGPTARPSSE